MGKREAEREAKQQAPPTLEEACYKFASSTERASKASREALESLESKITPELAKDAAKLETVCQATSEAAFYAGIIYGAAQQAKGNQAAWRNTDYVRAAEKITKCVYGLEAYLQAEFEALEYLEGDQACIDRRTETLNRLRQKVAEPLGEAIGAIVRVFDSAVVRQAAQAQARGWKPTAKPKVVAKPKQLSAATKRELSKLFVRTE